MSAQCISLIIWAYLASALEEKNVQQFVIDKVKELTPLLLELPAILQRFKSEGWLS